MITKLHSLNRQFSLDEIQMIADGLAHRITKMTDDNGRLLFNNKYGKKGKKFINTKEHKKLWDIVDYLKSFEE